MKSWGGVIVLLAKNSGRRSVWRVRQVFPEKIINFLKYYWAYYFFLIKQFRILRNTWLYRENKITHKIHSSSEEMNLQINFFYLFIIIKVVSLKNKKSYSKVISNPNIYNYTYVSRSVKNCVIEIADVWNISWKI